MNENSIFQDLTLNFRCWRAALVAVAAVAGGLVAPGSAAAAVPGLEAVDATLVASSKKSQSVTVQCPPNKVLINASGYITGGVGAVTLDDIFPDPTTQSVTVTGKETDPYAGNWRPTAVATCSDPLPGLVWEDETSLRSSSDKSVTVECPDETVLVGTGATVQDGSGEVLITSIAPQNGGPSVPADAVTVVASEDGAYNPTWIVTAFAACVGPPLPGQEVIRTASPAHDSTSPKSLSSATCDAGDVATGTGVGLIVDPAILGEVVIDDVFPNNVGSGAAPTSTTLYAAEEDATGLSWTLVGYALCADP
jgi:hypothetical protein